MNGFHFFIQKVVPGFGQAFDTGVKVNVGASQVKIRQHNLLSQQRQTHRQIGRQHRFADAPFSAANCNDFFVGFVDRWYIRIRFGFFGRQDFLHQRFG